MGPEPFSITMAPPFRYRMPGNGAEEFAGCVTSSWMSLPAGPVIFFVLWSSPAIGSRPSTSAAKRASLRASFPVSAAATNSSSCFRAAVGPSGTGVVLSSRPRLSERRQAGDRCGDRFPGSGCDRPSVRAVRSFSWHPNSLSRLSLEVFLRAVQILPARSLLAGDGMHGRGPLSLDSVACPGRAQQRLEGGSGHRAGVGRRDGREDDADRLGDGLLLEAELPQRHRGLDLLPERVDPGGGSAAVADGRGDAFGGVSGVRGVERRDVADDY